MSYVDAYIDRERDRIHVVERVNGKREYREYPANYVFYYDDAHGKHRTIFDTPVSRFATRNRKEFQKELKIQGHTTLYESDINPVFRCLEEAEAFAREQRPNEAGAMDYANAAGSLMQVLGIGR